MIGPNRSRIVSACGPRSVHAAALERAKKTPVPFFVSDGSIQTFVNKPGKHSEELVIESSETTGKKVLAMFSDRTPCTTKRTGDKIPCWDKVMDSPVFANMQELTFLSDWQNPDLTQKFADLIAKKLGL